jgi:hypothetical protein
MAQGYVLVLIYISCCLAVVTLWVGRRQLDDDDFDGKQASWRG